MEKKLSQGQVGEWVTVVKLPEDSEQQSILAKMGILPKDDLVLINKSLFGSPYFFKHQNEGCMAIRKSLADQILVKTKSYNK